ncbi:MAG TPA: GAF domain-containing sensor histidine kinase, partial [Longimicrobiaceae bacterium]
LVALRDITDRRRAEEQARELFRSESRRAEAEAAARRIAFLSEAGAILASSLDFRTTLNRVARLSVPFLADYCLVHILEDDGSLPQLASAHHDAAGDALLQELAGRYRVDPTRPESMVARVARTGRSELFGEIPPEVRDYVAADPEVRGILDALAPVSFMVVPLAAHDRTLGTITLASSVSGRRYAAEELALAEELARRAALAVENARLFEESREASRAKSNFLAVMSHELRTPLNAVIGYVDLLDAGIPCPPAEGQKDYLGRIRSSSAHLLQLIEEILAFTRMEAGEERVHSEPVELGGLARRVAAAVEPLASAQGLGLRLDLPARPLTVRTDPAKVRQILLNLLSNAVKFTDGGEVVLGAAADGDGALLRVRDTGIGIAPEHLERIWDPFWQVEQTATRVAEGTGLGLAVARDLARLLGGEISVRSAPGMGSTFEVYLPREAPSPPDAPGRAG